MAESTVNQWCTLRLIVIVFVNTEVGPTQTVAAYSLFNTFWVSQPRVIVKDRKKNTRTGQVLLSDRLARTHKV